MNQHGRMPSEAPITGPIVKDMNGNLWDERPDNLIVSYLRNITYLRGDEKMWLEGRVAMRDWLSISNLMERKLETMPEGNEDDRVRMNKILGTINSIERGA